MRLHKFISTILHPIVIPTVGVMIYFLLSPVFFDRHQKFTILFLIFAITYLLPLLALIVLKRFKMIKSYQLEGINERKIPLGIMIVVFYALANTLNQIPNLRELSVLFYSASFGLVLIYILLYFKIKASIHLISIGLPLGFFIILGLINSQSYLIVIIITILLAGVLASSRLHLKAHTPKEIYLGFFLGIISVFGVYYFL